MNAYKTPARTRKRTHCNPHLNIKNSERVASVPSELARQFRAEGGYGPYPTVRSKYRIHDFNILQNKRRHSESQIFTGTQTVRHYRKICPLSGFQKRILHSEKTTNKKGKDQLIKTGFEYVRYDEKHRDPVYRKRKQKSVMFTKKAYVKEFKQLVEKSPHLPHRPFLKL